MRTLLCIIAAICVLAGCSRKQPVDEDPRVQETLNRAGRNSAQLMEVLEHYADEPEKLAAARYLIANMPGHYGYAGAELDSVEMLLSPISKRKIEFALPPEQIQRWAKFNFFTLPRQDDQYYITADYLIANIDHAYDQWKNRKWNKNLPFEDFCELLLPYRIGDERISNWRKVYADLYGPRLESAYQGADALEATRILHDIIKNDGWRYNEDIQSPHRDAISLLDSRVGYNRDWCDLVTYAMRACGLPVAIDMLLETPGFGATHQWLVLRDNLTGRYLPFGFDNMELDRNHPAVVPRAKGKIYRYSFAPSPGRKEEIADIRSLPLRLNNLFVTDVSTDYFPADSVDVKVSLIKKINPMAAGKRELFDHVYLGMWVPDEWRPVDVGKIINDSTARFNNIEPGVLFAPLKLYENKFTTCGDAFYLTQYGELETLKPDSTAVEKVHLTRTFPLNIVSRQRHYNHIIGSKLLASPTPDFSQPSELLSIEDTLRGQRFIIPIEGEAANSRYLRYTRPTNYRISIGDVSVFDENGEKIPYRMLEKVELPFDGKFLSDSSVHTLFTAPEEMPWFTLELAAGGRKINRIEMIPRIDNFFLKNGHEYELAYLDGAKGWKSLGKQIAENEAVEFVVPANCLLKLMDLTDGTGGQAFIYRARRQFYSIDMLGLNGK